MAGTPSSTADEGTLSGGLLAQMKWSRCGCLEIGASGLCVGAVRLRSEHGQGPSPEGLAYAPHDGCAKRLAQLAVASIALAITHNKAYG